MFELREALGWFDKAVMFARGDELMSSVSTDSRQLQAGSCMCPCVASISTVMRSSIRP